jgi:hypothetical protein
VLVRPLLRRRHLPRQRLQIRLRSAAGIRLPGKNLGSLLVHRQVFTLVVKESAFGGLYGPRLVFVERARLNKERTRHTHTPNPETIVKNKS